MEVGLGWERAVTDTDNKRETKQRLVKEEEKLQADWLQIPNNKAQLWGRCVWMSC